jgi:lipoprotein-anchoring transpeptidase ErfK/SrfK
MKITPPALVRLSASLMFLLVVGCATTREEAAAPVAVRPVGSAAPPPPRYDLSHYWNGESVAGAPSIVIRQSQQRAYFYKGGIEVGSSPVGTGRAEFSTPNGEFKVLQKVEHYRSGQYGDYVDENGNVVQADVDSKLDPQPVGARFVGAPMPYFMRIVDGVGLHAGYVPGYPVSHGCIRLPKEMAKIFFENVSVGTPVTILP